MYNEGKIKKKGGKISDFEGERGTKNGKRGKRGRLDKTRLNTLTVRRHKRDRGSCVVGSDIVVKGEVWGGMWECSLP